MKQKYNSEIILQRNEETISSFNFRVESRVNEIMESQRTVGSPFCFPISEVNGKIGAIIQWFTKLEEQEFEASSILGIILELGNKKEQIIEEFIESPPYRNHNYKPYFEAGFDLCVENLQKIYEIVKARENG